MSLSIPRSTYADLYGPTTGDRIRLADTELIVEVEKDFTCYGDEITLAAAKSSATAWARAASRGGRRNMARSIW